MVLVTYREDPSHTAQIFFCHSLSRSFFIYIYSCTSVAQTPLGPWKFVLEMGISSH